MVLILLFGLWEFLGNNLLGNKWGFKKQTNTLQLILSTTNMEIDLGGKAWTDFEGKAMFLTNFFKHCPVSTTRSILTEFGTEVAS